MSERIHPASRLQIAAAISTFRLLATFRASTPVQAPARLELMKMVFILNAKI